MLTLVGTSSRCGSNARERAEKLEIRHIVREWSSQTSALSTSSAVPHEDTEPSLPWVTFRLRSSSRFMPTAKAISRMFRPVARHALPLVALVGAACSLSFNGKRVLGASTQADTAVGEAEGTTRALHAVSSKAVMNVSPDRYDLSDASNPDVILEVARQLAPEDLVHTSIALQRDRFDPVESSQYWKGSSWDCRGQEPLDPDYPMCGYWNEFHYAIKYDGSFDETELPAGTPGILWSAPTDPESRDWAFFVTLDGARYRVAVHELEPGPGDMEPRALVHRGLYLDDLLGFKESLEWDRYTAIKDADAALVACKDEIWNGEYRQQIQELEVANLLPDTRKARISRVRGKAQAHVREACAEHAQAKIDAFLNANREHDQRREQLFEALKPLFASKSAT